jgi:hypothetical protein
MITQILKKEYDQIQRKRKNMAAGTSLGYLVFHGEDGRYYKTDKTGMLGAKEIADFNKNFKHNIDSQSSLI